eukprot:147767_1
MYSAVSSYPCDNVEEFVLSKNRRKLLGIDYDTKDDSTNTQSSILSDSNQHIYYHLLQIENEITSILTNDNIENISKLDMDNVNALLNEANQIISKYEENIQNKHNSSQDINIMTFRHKLRKLFLSPYIKMEQ